MTLLAAATLSSSSLSLAAGASKSVETDQHVHCLSRLEYEYIAKGFIFRKGRIKVTVSRVGITSF